MDWDAIWSVFAGLFVLGFAVLEPWSIADTGGTKGTLSAAIRKFLGIEPQKPRRFVAGGAFLAFMAWFTIHILTPYL